MENNILNKENMTQFLKLASDPKYIGCRDFFIFTRLIKLCGRIGMISSKNEADFCYKKINELRDKHKENGISLDDMVEFIAEEIINFYGLR